MIKVRYGCFETNSSSVHSLIIANEEEYKQLLNGELFMDYNSFISKNEAIEILLNYIANEPRSEEWIREFCENEIGLDDVRLTKELFAALPTNELNAILNEFCGGIKSYEDYMNNEYLESYHEDYTSAHGDKIHIFGVYGRDC